MKPLPTPRTQEYQEGVLDYAPGVVRVSLGMGKRLHKKYKCETTRKSVEKHFRDNYPRLKVTRVINDSLCRFLVTLEER